MLKPYKSLGAKLSREAWKLAATLTILRQTAAKSPPPDSGLVDSSERKSLEYLSKEGKMGGSRACQGAVDFRIEFNSTAAGRGWQRISCRRVVSGEIACRTRIGT
jgi:hypothetical protein